MLISLPRSCCSYNSLSDVTVLEENMIQEGSHVALASQCKSSTPLNPDMLGEWGRLEQPLPIVHCMAGFPQVRVIRNPAFIPFYQVSVGCLQGHT